MSCRKRKTTIIATPQMGKFISEQTYGSSDAIGALECETYKKASAKTHAQPNLPQ